MVSTLSCQSDKVLAATDWFRLGEPSMAQDDNHITKVTTEEGEELVELPATAMMTGSGKSSRDESLLGRRKGLF